MRVRIGIAGSQEGDAPPDGESSFEGIYRELFPRLVSKCRSWGLNGAAEDIAQGALLQAYRHRQELDLLRPLWPWVLKVARNLAADRAKREGRQTLVDPVLLPDSCEDPPNIEERMLLSQALQRLPERQQMALTLRYVEDRDSVEAGEHLGLNRTAFDQLVHRGRLSLKAAYRQLAQGA